MLSCCATGDAAHTCTGGLGTRSAAAVHKLTPRRKSVGVVLEHALGASHRRPVGIDGLGRAEHESHRVALHRAKKKAVVPPRREGEEPG